MSTTHHQKGTKVNPIENNTKTPRTATRIFVALRGLLRVNASGASKISRGTGASSLALAFVLTTLAALALSAAPALAATPETPQLELRFPESTELPLRGVLNPNAAGEAGTYEFLYKEGGSCEGGGHTTPGMALGVQGEEVYERIGGLTPQTEYTICLVVENGSGGKAQSAPLTVFTGPPEEPEKLPATEITATTATLNGVLNPKKRGDTGTYEFLYNQSTEGCEDTQAELKAGKVQGRTPAGVAAGNSPEPVSAKVTGLLPATKYTFCLAAINAGEEITIGQPETFETAPAPPIINDESSSEVTSVGATVGAQIYASSLATTYRVEYGTSESYSSSTPEASIGAPEGYVNVQVPLSGLAPGTQYYYRFVATNERGTTESEEKATFTTTAGGPTATALPDGRVYEDVSLPTDGAGGEVYAPATGHARAGHHMIHTEYPVRAAADGDAVAYAGEATVSGGSGSTGEGGGDTFVATRGASAWEPVPITPPSEDSRGEFQGFSSDLSRAFLDESETPLAPEAPSPCVVLYSSDSKGTYSPVFTSTETPGKCGEPVFAGVSANDSSVIFESEARLTPQATEERSAREGEQTFNLYDSVDGHMYLVNVLPDGKSEVNAAFGGVSPESEESSNGVGYKHYGGAISANGSRIVWTDRNTGSLYVREDPSSPTASTVLVAEQAYFRGASSDGSKVFFTDELELTGNSTAQAGEPDLYEYEVNPEVGKPGTLIDLTVSASGHANVLGVLGYSEDGSYVYFVADGELANNSNANNETATAGSPNLYLYRGGETRFIATLSPGDDALFGASSHTYDPGEAQYGDWRAGLGARTAEVTPDGHAVLFMSRRSLTGYENTGGCIGYAGGPEVGCSEVFVYDASSQELFCASCNPTGAPPVAAHEEPVIRDGAFLMTPQPGEGKSPSYQLRTIADDGNRVFFDSAQPLVPQATAGIESVYEWEREGEGTCTAQSSSRFNGGCVFLVSGPSNEESVFVDADATGENVFFATRAQLVPEDKNDQVDLYDARVDGGFPHLVTQCTGTGCQGTPPAPPVFATPSSVTFNGAGNFPPPAPAIVKKVTKKTVKCAKGKKRNKHNQCVKVKTKHKKAKKSSRATNDRRAGR